MDWSDESDGSDQSDKLDEADSSGEALGPAAVPGYDITR
jgi:hypothetical protein